MFLLNATGVGEFSFKNRTYGTSGKLNNDIIIGLEHDYIKNGAQEVGVGQTNGIPRNVYTKEQIGGDSYYYNTTEGAYYNVAEKPIGENLYKFFDLGANLGVGYTFSSGLAFNLRGTYGLLDATDNRYERKWQASTGAPNYKIQQFDRDMRNFNVALTIGFSF